MVFIFGAPFVGQFVEVLPVLGKLFRRRFDGLDVFGCGFEFDGQADKRVGDGVGRGGQELAQDKRHQGSLAGRQGIEDWLLEVIGNQVVQPLFVRRWLEFLHQGMAIGVFDVLQHLLAECPLANRLEAFFQVGEVVVVGQASKAGAVGLDVAEGEIVDDADQAVQLQERVLQRRGG